MFIQFSTLFLASAALLSVVGASPTSQQTSDKPTISISNQNVTTKPSQDDIIKHLDDNKHIEWKPHGNGRYCDIPANVWQEGKANVTKRATGPALEKRKGGGTTGSISGYAGKIACYGSGAQMGLDTINKEIVTGCENLLTSSLPPLAVNALRVWNSPTLSDWQGKASYLRFGVEILTSGAPANTGICEAALQKFNDFCEGDGQQSRGGEVTVGDDTKYTMDPTDL
ncbi:hypothetical protein EV356DRAFT_581572 [Viridothelium virens]|uniref:Ecp2 effector protein domain-containing protein n=1 Tax=Viridothelium virens TaxID=1048519 RepID=A0A6A6GSC3_VIRVR|nr:hypothetical protein EV356DRAFT_581572 [Viridothelium virens]